MKYKGICLAVKDICRATKFYQELFGVEVFQDYGTHVSFGELSIQQGFDALVGVSKEDMAAQPNDMELYFEEDDFDSFLRRLQARQDLRLLGRVQEAPWGQRCVRFYDPDGHLIEVGETLVRVIRRFLDAGMTPAQVSQRMGISLSDMEKLLQA